MNTTRSPAAVMVVGRRATVLVARRQSLRVPFELRTGPASQPNGRLLSNVSHMLLILSRIFWSHSNVSLRRRGSNTFPRNFPRLASMPPSITALAKAP